MMINILGRAVAQENENLSSRTHSLTVTGTDTLAGLDTGKLPKTKSKYPTNNFSLRFFLTDPIIVNMFSI